MENVTYDLKIKEKCSFVTMLKALMLRRMMMKDTSRKVFTATAEEWETINQKFVTYLDDGVEFVNGPEGRILRRELKAYCGFAEGKSRSPPFVNALNQMLLHARQLKSRDDEINDGDVIFAINDPVINIESHRLPKSTKRKPDLVCVLAEKFSSLFHKDSRLGFKACMKSAAKPEGDDKELEPQYAKSTWGDILQSWELVATQEIKSKVRTDFKVDEFLNGDQVETSSSMDEPPIVSTSPCQTSATSGLKRKRGSTNIPALKKIKVDEEIVPLEARLPNDVQCAFYGIERLQHSMDITHSMTVLVNDANLTFSWYDSQGCIEADSIDIIEALPLLAVMIRIFEDFPLGMWGYTPIEVWAEDENQTKMPYYRKENPVGSFQIIGRRSFTADATASQPKLQTATPTTTLSRRRSSSLGHGGTQTPPSTSGDDECCSQDEQPEDGKSGDILFLKSAWPETKHWKEPGVIAEAYKRAEELLGMEARSVTDHLPVIVNSQELAYTSTEIIRRLVKSTRTSGFRVQLWMLSKKLQPIHALDPKDFWKAFWHTLRCHALLWRIGIAHGDVSLYNLMSKEGNKFGVLNDFDLATVMEPGDHSPNRQGLERTGTLPFMAMELLENEGFDCKIRRRYRHELESFAWVLVWVSRSVVSGEERELPRRLREWLGNENEEVMKSKSMFIRQQRGIPMTPDYLWLESALFRWIKNWDHLFQQILDRSPLPEKTISEHVQTFVAICTECAEADSLVSVPIDVTWVDGLEELTFARSTS